MSNSDVIERLRMLLDGYESGQVLAKQLKKELASLVEELADVPKDLAKESRDITARIVKGDRKASADALDEGEPAAEALTELRDLLDRLPD